MLTYSYATATCGLWTMQSTGALISDSFFACFFLQIPPVVPSASAVDLLVATAGLQRYLERAALVLPRPHPGHLNALELWRSHVLRWIGNTQK